LDLGGETVPLPNYWGTCPGSSQSLRYHVVRSL